MIDIPLDKLLGIATGTCGRTRRNSRSCGADRSHAPAQEILDEAQKDHPPEANCSRL